MTSFASKRSCCGATCAGGAVSALASRKASRGRPSLIISAPVSPRTTLSPGTLTYSATACVTPISASSRHVFATLNVTAPSGSMGTRTVMGDVPFARQLYVSVRSIALATASLSFLRTRVPPFTPRPLRRGRQMDASASTLGSPNLMSDKAFLLASRKNSVKSVSSPTWYRVLTPSSDAPSTKLSITWPFITTSGLSIVFTSTSPCVTCAMPSTVAMSRPTNSCSSCEARVAAQNFFTANCRCSVLPLPWKASVMNTTVEPGCLQLKVTTASPSVPLGSCSTPVKLLYTSGSAMGSAARRSSEGLGKPPELVSST
mmetsp:Transcript_5860/g.21406  ORF Transcript_5860/g.21406 Transcript_5860/m.21406 type:complete len:315 (+) Transcript_5860:427-1371(+)